MFERSWCLLLYFYGNNTNDNGHKMNVDLLVTSPDHRTHKKHLKILLTRLAEYGIIIGPDKCQFGTTELSFLGHHVSEAGISPLASAVDAIINLVRPEKQRALR